MPGQEDRAARREQSVGEAVERRVAWTAGGVHPCRLAELERILLVENVARQRDEDGSGRRGHRDLRRAPQDAGHVLEPVDLHRPFDDRLGDRHQRGVEHRLGEAVPLFLLPGGDDDRRAHPVGVEERAHRVAEPGGDMDVAGAEMAGGARVAVRHRHHQRLLQRHHIGDRRAVRQRGHDRQLGGAGVAEQMRHPLALKQREKGLAAEYRVHGVGHDALGKLGSILEDGDFSMPRQPDSGARSRPAYTVRWRRTANA